ncbi:peptidase S9 prolyl oligopeptidase active site-containing protein [Lasiosphaeria hispida]|uniref:Peptidase S9 prolyl oligopeptidase active site-containing protein n=1 Tax=Lasiosphaeria hispida TaxID=260671 RepID=A0AAJ0HQK3_9PEZI|nr:peptidase S9 prolyl oligopeptidase active site-containing protein [Lasiosphaeria hispida]
MAIIKIAPHGDWKSGISAEAATAGSRSLTSPRVCPKTGRAFFLESRPNGTNGIVEITTSGLKHVLPDGFSASTAVYEYGGSSYLPISGDKLRIIFSDAHRQSLNLLHVDNGTVEPLLQSTTLRYADFDAHPSIDDGTENNAWVLAIEEDHVRPKPADVKDYVVAINLITKEIRRVVEGADFYSYPRFSPDGRQLAWLQWNHPDLPFLGVTLHLAEFSLTDASLSGTRLVAGEEGDSIAEPRWSPDGQLFFGSDKSGFRQLSKLRDGAKETILLPGLEDAEFGDAHWAVGCQGYVFLNKDSVIAAPVRFGGYQLVHIDLKTRNWTKLDIPLADLRGDCLARLSDTAFFVIGSGFTTPKGVYRVEILADLTVTATLVCSSVDEALPETLFSTPQHIRFTTLKDPHREVHGFFWPPHNPRFVAPEGALPPLIVRPHGGPTGHTPPGLDLMVQYFTSRGYGYFAINYTGSSAHGKAYREALFGEWGILDRDDVAEAVDHLAWSGRIDRSRVGIEGGSAGGYNVLCSMTWHPDVFAGGICYCGVSDIKALDAETHKMESHYIKVLLGLKNKTEEEKEELFKARSPLFHAESITAPLLLVHGDVDTIVPVEQSKEIKRKIEKRGGDVDLIVLEGEGHMFKRAESWQTILVEGEKWWRKTLLKPSPPLAGMSITLR